jgi:hypothetical protein
VSDFRPEVESDVLEERFARHSTWPSAACGELIGALRRLDDAGLATPHDQDELALLVISLEDRKNRFEGSPILG